MMTEEKIRVDLINKINEENNKDVKDILRNIEANRESEKNICLLKDFITEISKDPRYTYVQNELLKEGNEWNEGAIGLCLSLIPRLENNEAKVVNLSGCDNDNQTDDIQANDNQDDEIFKSTESESDRDDHENIPNLDKNKQDWLQKTPSEKKRELIDQSIKFNNNEVNDCDLLDCLNSAFAILDTVNVDIDIDNNAKQILLIGNTGAGKTTIAHYLEDNKLVGEWKTLSYKLNLKEESADNLRTIGRTGSSETFYPNIFKVKGISSAHQVVDLAGVNDNNGIFIRIANDYVKKKYFRELQQVKIIFVLEYSLLALTDWSSIINLIKNSFPKEIDNITDSRQINFSIIINKVPNRFESMDPTKIENEVKEECARHLVAYKVGISDKLYNIICENFKNIALIFEASKKGDYKITGQRERLLEFIESAKTVSPLYFFEQETFEVDNFIKTIKGLDLTGELIEILKKKVYLSITNLEIKHLNDTINYYCKAKDINDTLRRLSNKQLDEDKAYLATLLKRQKKFIDTLYKAKKYFLNNEIESIIEGSKNAIAKELTAAQTFLIGLDNTNKISVSINDNIITIKAPYISTASINSTIAKHVQDQSTVDLIKVLAYVVDFNSNLTLPSKTLLIKCCNYKLNKEVEINLSGLDANGINGENDGGNSGHFLLDIRQNKRKVHDISALKNLKIITNGGKGLDGKDGGNGTVGENMFHLPGSESRASESILTNVEQIAILKKIQGQEKADKEHAKSLVESAEISNIDESKQERDSNNIEERKLTDKEANNITAEIKQFRYLVGDSFSSEDIFESSQESVLSSEEEQQKIVEIHKILDILLKKPKDILLFLDSLFFMKWEAIYKKINETWESERCEGAGARNAPSTCNSLVRIHNSGYIFNSTELLEFSLINASTVHSLEKNIVRHASNISAVGGAVTAATAAGVAGFCTLVFGFNESQQITIPASMITIAGLSVCAGGVAVKHKLDNLPNYILDIRYSNPSEKQYGKKGEDGKSGGNGGNSGCSIILLPSKNMENSAQENIEQGAKGEAGKGGKGGKIGKNGIMEYILTITKDNKMLQLGHFFSRLPENSEDENYKKYVVDNQSKDGSNGSAGEESSLSEDVKEEFLNLDITDQPREFWNEDYTPALMGEEFSE